VSCHKVVNKLIISNDCLIWLYHTSIRNAELSILDQLLDTSLLSWNLFLEPNLEKGELGISKVPFGVLLQTDDDLSEHLIDGG